MPGSENTSRPSDADESASSDGQIQGTEIATTGDSQPPATPTQNAEERRFPSIRNLIINFFLVILFSHYVFPGSKKAANPSSDPGSPSNTAAQNLFGKGFPMDLYVYVSEDNFEADFFNPSELIWVKKNIIYGDWTQGPNKDSTYQAEFDITLSSRVQRNGSLWLHCYFVKSGFIPFEESRTAENFSPIYTLHTKKQLNRFKKRRYRDTHNLITGKTEKSEEEQEKIKNKVQEEIISHWHPNLTISMIYDYTPWNQGALPANLDEFITFEPTSGRYYPIVYLNDYWNFMRDYQPINETVETVHLSLIYQPISMMKWQLYIAHGTQNKWSKMLGAEAMQNEDEQDYIKETLLETSPILLGLTFIVSITHSVFEFLAFKNDIQFWKDRKSLEGLSVRSIFFNLFQSVVVLLYVLDNDTSALIRISLGIGLLIELWKIPKVVNIKVDRSQRVYGVFPKVVFEDKGSYVDSSTKQYDIMAYKYLGWVVFPLFIGYSIYSLIYLEHKGWYSFVLNMMYGFLLAFGFIMMTPQLFINYKLKSVAHLPWRMLSYKFLNTFIDDIFAFVIKMPLMYRLGCFRDDIIFIIYVYQRWIYRVDPKRVNEFGISGEELQENANKKKSIQGPSNSPALQSSSSGDRVQHTKEDKKRV